MIPIKRTEPKKFICFHQALDSRELTLKDLWFAGPEFTPSNCTVGELKNSLYGCGVSEIPASRQRLLPYGRPFYVFADDAALLQEFFMGDVGYDWTDELYHI